MLCTMTLDGLSINGGPSRFPVGTWPILDPASKEVLVDEKGRCSYSTSTSYCPSIGEHVVMGYLPSERARVGEKLMLEYFDEGGNGLCPMTVRIVGRGSLFDPANLRAHG
jgi:glycine cleavage system aminomethyltransferase T